MRRSDPALHGRRTSRWGSLNSDDEPDRATWVVVSLPAAALAVSIVAGGITWVIDQLRR